MLGLIAFILRERSPVILEDYGNFTAHFLVQAKAFESFDIAAI